MRMTIALGLLALAGCGAMPDRRCMQPGETGIITNVTSQDVRGGGRDWRVAFRDARGMTRVCSAGDDAQALKPGDRIDGTGMWK